MKPTWKFGIVIFITGIILLSSLYVYIDVYEPDTDGDEIPDVIDQADLGPLCRILLRVLDDSASNTIDYDVGLDGVKITNSDNVDIRYTNHGGYVSVDTLQDHGITIKLEKIGYETILITVQTPNTGIFDIERRM